MSTPIYYFVYTSGIIRRTIIEAFQDYLAVFNITVENIQDYTIEQLSIATEIEIQIFQYNLMPKIPFPSNKAVFLQITNVYYLCLPLDVYCNYTPVGVIHRGGFTLFKDVTFNEIDRWFEIANYPFEPFFAIHNNINGETLLLGFKTMDDESKQLVDNINQQIQRIKHQMLYIQGYIQEHINKVTKLFSDFISKVRAKKIQVDENKISRIIKFIPRLTSNAIAISIVTSRNNTIKGLTANVEELYRLTL